MMIDTRKELRCGIKGRIITGFSRVKSLGELPTEYKNACGMMYLKGGESGICIMGGADLNKGEWISEETFQETLTKIKAAGKRLREINIKLKEDWNGNETFIF